MKELEDIQNMDWEALEKAAGEENIPVPEGLQGRIRQRLAAEELKDSAPSRKRLLIPAASLAAAASIAAIAYFAGRTVSGPQDTFDDPYLAYAQVERTFRQISGKMASGIEASRKAASSAGKTVEDAYSIISKNNGQ